MDPIQALDAGGKIIQLGFAGFSLLLLIMLVWSIKTFWQELSMVPIML